MKKGVADTNKVLYWTLFLLPIISLFAFLLLYAVPEIGSIRAGVSERLKDTLIQDKLLGSECFGHEEKGVVRTGYIDLLKYKKLIVHGCLEGFEPEKQFSLNLRFKGQEKEIFSQNYVSPRRSVSYDRPVIVVDGENSYNGVLEIKFTY